MYSAIKLNYDSLEPFISDDTLMEHYNIYLNYVKKLNDLLSTTNEIYSKAYLIQHIDVLPLTIRGEVLYYLSGVINHELYFFGLSNDTKNYDNRLVDDIIATYGSLDNFKGEFKKQGLNIKGSGYTFLVLDDNKKLRILNTSNQDNPYYYGYIPVMAMDVWEHAYYLDYYSKRSEYIDKYFEKLDYTKLSINYENILKNQEYFLI